MMSKKGISSVISTVLVILLVVVAIAIIGVVVLNTVNKGANQISSSVSCQQIQVVTSKCSYNSTSPGPANPVVLVKRNSAPGNIINLSLIFYKSSITEVRSVLSLPNILDTRSYDLSDPLQVAGGYLGSTSSPDSVAVTVTLRGTNGNIINCPQSQKINCNPSLSLTNNNPQGNPNPPNNGSNNGGNNTNQSGNGPGTNPFGLVATNVSASEIDLTWNNATGADTYDIYLSTDGGVHYLSTPNMSVQTFGNMLPLSSFLPARIIGLKNGTNYTFEVIATSSTNNTLFQIASGVGSTTYSLYDLTSSLVAYYPEDLGSSTVTDYSGNGINGSTYNNTGITSLPFGGGISGGTYYFNGVDQYINVSSSPVFSNLGQSNFTVSIWFRINSGIQNQHYGLLSIAGGSTKNRVNFIARRNAIGNFFDYWDSSPNGWKESGVSPSIGVWHHGAWVVSSSAVQFYLDGVNVANSSLTNSPPIDSSAYLMIGRTNFGSEYFNGTIDQIRIYNKVLPAAEIAYINNTKA